MLWPVLLRSIYRNQLEATAVASWTSCTETSQDRLEKGVGGEHAYQALNEVGHEDRVVIRLVERSWDLVPPDVVR